jgi:hypothetical protein
METSRTPIEPGSLWRHVMLDSEALYEVIAPDGEHVEVLVRHAPGLAPGTSIRMTRAALLAMEPFVEADPAPDAQSASAEGEAEARRAHGD